MEKELYLTKHQITLVKEFISKNKSFYDDYELEILIKSIYSPYKLKYIPNLLNQIYDILDIINPKDNIYDFFVDYIEKIHSLDKNIVEIGGGVIPSIAKKIALRQKKGTITVYDPRLITKNFHLPNLELKKEPFTSTTNLSNVDLLIGFMPCEATELIIDKASQENIDFIIALSDNISQKDFAFYESIDEWQHYIICHAKRKLESTTLGNLKYKYIKKGWEFPIIYNERVR